MTPVQYHVSVYIPQILKLEREVSTAIKYQQFGVISLFYPFSFLSFLLYGKKKTNGVIVQQYVRYLIHRLRVVSYGQYGATETRFTYPPEF